MKFKRLIVMTVLLLTVGAVVVPNRHELWRAVGYEDRRAFVLGTQEWENPVLLMRYRAKRVHWFPGPDALLPAQVCYSCRMPRHLGHDACKDGKGFAIPLLRDPHSVQVEPGEWHCTCPDPRHKWNQ